METKKLKKFVCCVIANRRKMTPGRVKLLPPFFLANVRGARASRTQGGGNPQRKKIIHFQGILREEPFRERGSGGVHKKTGEAKKS